MRTLPRGAAAIVPVLRLACKEFARRRYAGRLEAGPARPQPAPSRQSDGRADQARRWPEGSRRRGSIDRHDNRDGKLVFGIFAALAEFERELIVERTKAGLASARAITAWRPRKDWSGPR